MLGSPEVRNRKILSGPSSRKKSTTPWRKPVSSDATVTTVVMPITIPRMVSSERKRCVHTACTAICMFSAALIFMVYSALSAATGSSLAAREAGYHPEATPTTDDTPIARIT